LASAAALPCSCRGKIGSIRTLGGASGCEHRNQASGEYTFFAFRSRTDAFLERDEEGIFRGNQHEFPRPPGNRPEDRGVRKAAAGSLPGRRAASPGSREPRCVGFALPVRSAASGHRRRCSVPDRGVS